jgi:hypothetical protein
MLCSACATATPPVDVTVRSDVSCRAFNTVSWSPHDTVTTIHGVRRHNAAFTRICLRGKRTSQKALK